MKQQQPWMLQTGDCNQCQILVSSSDCSLLRESHEVAKCCPLLISSKKMVLKQNWNRSYPEPQVSAKSWLWQKGRWIHGLSSHVYKNVSFSRLYSVATFREVEGLRYNIPCPWQRIHLWLLDVTNLILGKRIHSPQILNQISLIYKLYLGPRKRFA